MKINIMEIDHEYTDEIVCPHCGYEHPDSEDYMDRDDEFICHECEKKFEYVRDYSISYISNKK